MIRENSIFLLLYFYSYDLFLININIPAVLKTKNNNNSKISFFIIKEPPIKANGIDPIMKGANNLKYGCQPNIINRISNYYDITIKAITGKCNKVYPN